MSPDAQHRGRGAAGLESGRLRNLAVAYAVGMFHAFVETVTGLNVADPADLADCLGGPATTPTPPPPTEAADCLGVYDFDLDGDVDLADLAELQTRWR